MEVNSGQIHWRELTATAAKPTTRLAVVFQVSTSIGIEMGILSSLAVSGLAVAIGAAVRDTYKNSQETKRRKNSPLRFDCRVPESEFIDIVQGAAQRTPRVKDVAVNGMTVKLLVGSNSGLTTWAAEIDFSDYGHLTGKYWLRSENSQSPIPEHFAQTVRAQIQDRVTQ